MAVALVSLALTYPGGASSAVAAASQPRFEGDDARLIVGYVKHDEVTSSAEYSGEVHMEYTFEGLEQLLNQDADWHEQRATANGSASLTNSWVSEDCSNTQTTTWLGDIGTEYGPSVFVDWRFDTYEVTVGPGSLYRETYTSSCGPGSSQDYDGMWAGWSGGTGYAPYTDDWWIFPD